MGRAAIFYYGVLCRRVPRLSTWADLSSLFGEFRTNIEDGYV